MKPTEPQTTFMELVVRSQGRCRARAALQPVHISRDFTSAVRDAASAVTLTRHARRKSFLLAVGVWRTGCRTLTWIWERRCSDVASESHLPWKTQRKGGAGGWIVVSSHGRNRETTLSLTEWASAGGLAFYQAHVWSCLNARQRPIDNTLLTAAYIMVWVVPPCCICFGRTVLTNSYLVSPSAGFTLIVCLLRSCFYKPWPLCSLLCVLMVLNIRPEERGWKLASR